MFSSGSASASSSLFDRNIFLFSQRHFTIGEKYNVADEEGNTLLFIERPAHILRNLGAGVGGALFGLFLMGSLLLTRRMLPDHHVLAVPIALLAIFGGLIGGLFMGIALSQKRHVTVYEDDSKAVPLLKIRQDQKVSFITSTFTVHDLSGSPLARFHKNHFHDIFRKQWKIYDAAGALIFIAREDSVLRAILRRFLGPAFGFLRTNFHFVKDHKIYGEFNRKFTLFDRYTLDLTRDTEKLIDRRIAVSLGVMLDTGERR